nr:MULTISPECIES: Shedu immune nuclease family protein [Agrobacterium]
MSRELVNRRKEGFWQEYFVQNPFVLKMLFGLPVIMYTDQASIGGMGLKRSGEKYADYLIEAGLLGNLGIVEIKTTETPLLTKDPYRPPTLYGPSADLSGGVNQLLDQKLRLIKGIAAKKEDDDQPHIQAWSVPCILIIGRLPETRDLKRSFEIYRGSQRDVLIITFDELLAKLKALHEFLSTKPDEPKEELSDQYADLL